jgi:glycerol kinase
VLQANPGWRARLERGELLTGTLDTFLIWRWTSGEHFVTDASMAARTLLMDVRRQQWSPQLCELFGIPPGILPEIKPSTGMNVRLDSGLTLQASIGDQSAALFASVSDDWGEALVNLGTGCFVVRYLPDEYLSAGKSVLDGYLHTLVYQDSARHAHLAVEGTLNSVAAALAPYPVDECRIGDAAIEDIFCVAEPSGIGAPYFRNDIGTRFSKSVEHLAQSQVASLLLEAVVFRVARVLEDFHRISPIERVYLSGGLSELPCLQQGIARCAPSAIFRLNQPESSLNGAALIAAGIAPAYNRKSERVAVDSNDEALVNKYRRWKKWLDDLLSP